MSKTETKKAGAATASEEKTADVNVQETAPVASTEAPIVAQPEQAETTPKTRLFHRKACDSTKDSTMTVIKEGETFNRTNSNVQIPNPDAEAATETPYVTVPVYSLKRGKRIYYTPYVTPEQAAAADALAEAKAKEKAEKEKKDAEKAAAAAAAAPAAAPAAAAAEEAKA